jgi:hypothetical protein
MPINSIEGKWTGHFKYDQGFPFHIQTRYVYFTIELFDKNGVITGTCTDDHTQHLKIDPATISGTYKDNSIVFIKKYPCFFTLDKNNQMVILHDRPAQDVEFFGRLKKRLFSSEYYFQGKSKATVKYTNKMGIEKNHDFWTTWSMKKLQ